MTALKLVLLLAFVSAASADTDNNSLDRIANTAHGLVANFTSFWGVEPPSGDTVLHALKNMSDTISTTMRRVVTTVQDEIQAHSGQASETMRSIAANLNRTIAALDTPENRRRAEDLRSHISSSLQTIAQEATRLKDTVARDTQGLRAEVHQAFGEAVSATQRLGERVADAAREHQEQHGNQ